MKRILELVKRGHYVRMSVWNLTEGPHAEWLIRQRPRKENKKMSCTGLGDLSFTAIDTYLFFVMSFPRERKCVSPLAPSTVAPRAGQSGGVAHRGA